MKFKVKKSLGQNFLIDKNILKKIVDTGKITKDDKILEIPDYIKIDVDGIEHLILSGAENYLKDPNIRPSITDVIYLTIETSNNTLSPMMVTTDTNKKETNNNNNILV